MQHERDDLQHQRDELQHQRNELSAYLRKHMKNCLVQLTEAANLSSTALTAPSASDDIFRDEEATATTKEVDSDNQRMDLRLRLELPH